MTVPETTDIVIVYASQNGNSKAIAESINDLLTENGFETKLYCISKYEKEFNFNELKSPLVFVCSTTGDGEPPETAVRCYNKLKRLDSEKNSQFLSNLNFALLGLGDSNYSQFANGPKLFYKKFTELGAKCFYGPFYADDGVGLELVVEPFKQDLIDALLNLLDQLDSNNNQKDKKESNLLDIIIDNTVTLKMHSLSLDELTLPELTENHLEIEEINENDNSFNFLKLISNMYLQSTSGIYKAKLTNNSILTKSESEKDCYCLKFVLNEVFDQDGKSLNDNLFPYDSGHAIDIVCGNNKTEVDNLLKRLKIEDRNKMFSIKSTNPSKKLGSTFVKLTESNKITYEQFFTYCVDIRNASLKKALLRVLAHYCSDEKDKIRLLELSSKEGSDDYQNMIKQSALTLLDLLNIFESCQPDVSHLIQMLMPLTTRSYTLCSAFDKENTEMEIIFNLVKFKRENNRTYERNGIASDYLSKLNKNEEFYFLKRKFQNFTFPTESDKPIIMIGPGTGIAPFVSYLRSIKNQRKIDENPHLWLFYGCRHPERDFLYKDEFLNEYSQYLEKYSLSFSRFTISQEDPILKYHISNSKYVQDSIRHYSKEMVNLINDLNGYIYICGDALNMSKDVYNCFKECLSKELNISSEDSNKYLLEMMKTRRYKQDIWA
jgi:methionine synthase reductase